MAQTATINGASALSNQFNPSHNTEEESIVGRISHREAGGPDLNYLYATNIDDSEVTPTPTDTLTNKEALSSITDSKSPKKKAQKQKSNPKTPVVIQDPNTKREIKRGRKSDKRSLRGQTLYLGGEEGPNNKIYCIPGHAERVLAIDTKTDDVYPIGPIMEGKFKWLRGIVIGDIIYGLPCHADCVLRIDTKTDNVSTIPIPYEECFDDTDVVDQSQKIQSKAHLERFREWKYHGGAISPHDNCIYCVPQSALRVLRIDPTSETCSFVGPEYEGRCKWYGGVVGNTDGAIYAIPQNATSVLRIDASGVEYKGKSGEFQSSTSEERVLVSTHGSFPLGGHKWHGAAASGDGTIVSVPANANNILCIVPAPSPAYPPADPDNVVVPSPTLYILEGETPQDIATGRHRNDEKYKYLGAMEGTDGKVYCFPSGSERVLQIDTARRVARSVGPNLRDKQMERLFQNKWQNGLTTYQEGCVYAIPLAAETVLRIGTGASQKQHAADVEVTTWKLPEPNDTLAKWEGGVLASNGIMYCMPNNHKAVLQIVPPCVPSRDAMAKERQKREKEREQVRELRRQMKQQQLEKEKQEKKEKKREKKERNEKKRQEDCGEKSNVNSKSVLNCKSEHNGSRTRTYGVDGDSTGDGVFFKYKTGIATLRSSAHRVKYSLDHRKHDPNPVGNDGKSTNTTFLPADLCEEHIQPYSTKDYDLKKAVAELLERCDEELVGKFQPLEEEIDVVEMERGVKNLSLNDNDSKDDSIVSINNDNPLASEKGTPDLECFVVPLKSLTRKCQKGNTERAQQYFSTMVCADTAFLSVFDSFVKDVVLPQFKRRLQNAGVSKANGPIEFYYQRPPTLRLQPGPARALVLAHDDGEYGHQNGELNFWLPLTCRRRTGVDLWCESKAGVGDYHPLEVEYGEVVSFHGSSCRHYVNSNHSIWTRVSLDFRVGVEGYYDPNWQMLGTTDDHSRQKITI